MTAPGYIALALASILGLAVVGRWLTPKHYPVLVAYALGLSLGTSGWLGEGDLAVLSTAMRASVAIAIPALLLESSLRHLRLLGRSGTVAGLSVWAGACLAAASMVGVFGQPAREAALSLAIFTGSLANLQAAGVALGVTPSELAAANLGDVVAGGLLFLLLTSLGPGVVRAVLRKRPPDDLEAATSPAVPLDLARDDSAPLSGRAYAYAVLLAAGAIGIGSLAAALLSSSGVMLSGELVILGLATTLSIAAASTFVSPEVATAGARIGEGLMIAFCFLVGSAADLSTVYGEALTWALNMGLFLLIQIAAALAIARWLGVEGGTFILALAGAVYSPAFVGPVAHAARRRDLIAVGVIWGLIGLALGTPVALAFVALVD